MVVSETEGMPGVIFEANAFGVPVIASDVGGTRSCVIHGETGILVQESEPSGFEDALETLIQAPETGRRMGRSGKAWVTENFTIDHIAKRYSAFFETLLSNGLA